MHPMAMVLLFPVISNNDDVIVSCYTNLSINGKKLSMRNGRCENVRKCAQAPRVRQCSVKFGRNISLVDCLL